NDIEAQAQAFCTLLRATVEWFEDLRDDRRRNRLPFIMDGHDYVIAVVAGGHADRIPPMLDSIPDQIRDHLLQTIGITLPLQVVGRLTGNGAAGMRLLHLGHLLDADPSEIAGLSLDRDATSQPAAREIEHI